MSIGWHGSFDRLGIHHVELFKHIMGVLGLANECPFLHLLDSKSKEEFQLTHHGHLKSLSYNPTKLITIHMVSTTKYYVIDIYLAHKYIISNFVSKECRVGFAYFKALFEQEFLKAFIPCSWCLLKPIERLLEFIDMIRELGFFKSWWLLHIYQLLYWAVEECTLDIHLV